MIYTFVTWNIQCGVLVCENPGAVAWGCRQDRKYALPDGTPFVASRGIAPGVKPRLHDVSVSAQSAFAGQSKSLCRVLAGLPLDETEKGTAEIVPTLCCLQEAPSFVAPHVARLGGPACWQGHNPDGRDPWYGWRETPGANYFLGAYNGQQTGCTTTVHRVETVAPPSTGPMLVTYLPAVGVYVINLHWTVGKLRNAVANSKPLIRKYAKLPTLIGGDFNGVPRSTELEDEGYFHLAGEGIDSLWASEVLGDCRVPGTYSGPVSGLVSPTTGLRLSDHDPVVCTLEL